MPLTEVKIPTCICPSCGAIDPETENYDAPALLEYATGYDPSFGGYRCLSCGLVSEAEDWDRLAGEICCECGAIGRHACPADAERKPVLPELPAGFKFITLSEVA